MNRVACVLTLIVIAGASACVAVAPVVQGKVVAVEQGGGVLRIQDEEAPDRAPVALDITSAEIGVTPKVGDRVRVVYEARPASNRAQRVMNLSRHQSDR